ncbi:SRPBCC domain-containing protein [Schinkia azotoformans]|uniref:SRPBCC family protein n=1 Tax=Schinkia azotoformans TaxID=1454 RepID=UPI002DB835A5|nr:SRPBCC domain-containing protein [Schinkia azotoformans]MEC1720248.1 SRPBCC domain-containing protein [Schinkia azotoformans]MED4353670.1 SRPBCC domain-containing protein [Schinkia azotoformans]MED4413251.1 SRPBCC domain-containing protein [Schinkia azotoformans]
MHKQEKLPEIRKTIVVDAPIEKVWKAVSTSEGIAAWWMANTFEPVLGKDFILHAGPYGDSPCKVTELDPPNCVGFDWDKGWHLTFELKSLEDGKTEFTLIHSGWSVENSKTREIMNEGWEKIVKEQLPKYIGA